MRVTDLDAQIPDQIGHAFGYYDYGEEIGMDSFSAVKMRWQTISPDMCGWHLLAVCFMASVSLVGAISPISCRDRSWALKRAWNL